MKYGARQKLTRLITQSQSYKLRVLSDTINSSPAFWEQQINKKRVCQKLILTRNGNPMIITMISVCSEMITYKAVKANSWLRYRFPYLNIGNRQAVWFWWRSEWAQSLSALSSVSTFVLLVRVVVQSSWLGLFFGGLFLFIFSLSFSLAFDRPMNLFIQFASKSRFSLDNI